MRKIILLSLIAFSVGSIIVYIANKPLKEFSPRIIVSQKAFFKLLPESGIFNVNGDLSIELRINTTGGITSIKSYLNFNPSLLKVVSIDFTNSDFGNIWEKAFDNKTGKIKIQTSTPAPGFTGSDGLIAKINFKTMATGQASISYDASSLALVPSDDNILNITNSAIANFKINSSVK